LPSDEVHHNNIVSAKWGLLLGASEGYLRAIWMLPNDVVSQARIKGLSGPRHFLLFAENIYKALLKFNFVYTPFSSFLTFIGHWGSAWSI